MCDLFGLDIECTLRKGPVECLCLEVENNYSPSMRTIFAVQRKIEIFSYMSRWGKIA